MSAPHVKAVGAGAEGSPWTARGLFLAVAIVWGLNYLFVREGLTLSGPLWLAAARAGIGALGVGAVLLARPGPTRLDRRGRRDALLLGLPNTALFFGLWFVAAGQILPGETAVIVYTFPLWVALLSSFGTGAQRPVAATALAIALGFVGVVLLSEPWTSGLAGLPPLAVAELLLGALSWAAGTVLIQRRFSRAELREANGFQLMGGAAALLLASAVFEPNQLPAPSWTIVGIWLWLGLVGTAFAYGAWFWLLGGIPATRLSANTYLVPVVALLASSIFFGERLAPVQLLGVGLVLVSLYATGRHPLHPPRPDR